MSKLMQILKTVKPDCDFEHSTDYLEDGFFDSLAIVSVLTEIEKICGIEIDIVDIDEDDFVDEAGILNMVKRFGGDPALLG